MKTPRIPRTHFGEMLALYRAAHHWTLRDLAPAIGIGHATLMRIEHGYAMDAATLLKLMTWLLSQTTVAVGDRDH